MGNITKCEMGTINETYDGIIDSVGYFTDSATRELKSKTPEDVWRDADLKKTYSQ